MAELCLEILGTSFTISTDEEKAYLRKVLEKYRAAVETTQSISGITDPLNIAILTGFILCDELNKAEQQLKEESIEINKRTMKLISKLDKALKTYDK
ncbi:MAG: cell division protein ZapA [Treponema sp.]|jgi:cell division protein ZapA (FtsZ GTPase activity inhibitor)|nr:cell division protein ZapA [Treponema sp.]